ncbi:hypothetical protein LOTGIDRAFT_233588 [Lottia gigantea]|uniref:Prokineticin domain-containing protein n=1 Tax=Lottia gigantea TaxID=225164 RepID=V4A289_LOTGI|nr:hypothetical protein LOTGIDRAFT_233588 [Lottia gigantea]ESO90802.1 hypothetical protein LOTGIDRAFT_233588 [Lottia gigantea]
MKVLLCLAVVVVAAYAQSCSSDADCSAEQCCLYPLFGKKRFIFGDNFGHNSGKCTSLSLEGESCEPPEIHDPFNPKLHEWHCPCVPGFECHGEKEMHQSGSHSYTNPKCVAAGASTAVPTTSA